MFLAFDRTGHLWVACSSDGAGELYEYPRLPEAVSYNITPFFPPLRKIVGKRDFHNFALLAVNPSGLVSVGDQFYHSIFTFGPKDNGAAAPRLKLGGDKTQIDGKGGRTSRLSLTTRRLHEPQQPTSLSECLPLEPMETSRLSVCSKSRAARASPSIRKITFMLHPLTQ